MRKLWVCLFGVVAIVGISAAPAAATAVALFSSSAPGVAASPPVVPAGICAVTITAEGGRGGMYDGFTDAAGAAGAAVTARVPVDPGAILNVLVGGVGGTGGGDDGSLTGDGGVGGGGGGGIGAAGGGGASVVWLSTPTALVVAGAGGGANPAHPGGAGGLLGQSGGDGQTNGIGGVGTRSGKGGKADGTGGAGGGGSLDYAGGGGGGVGAGGAAGDNSPPNRDGGPGGTGNGVVGGAGGSGGGNGSNGTAGGSPPGTGSGGTSSFAGDGGAGVSPGGNAGTAPAQGSGAGGGGIGFGGGGGAGSGPAGGSAGGGAGYGAGGGASGDGGGGGGGGSSYVTPSALSSSSAASTRSGDGQVTITYDPVADACPDTTYPTVDLRTPPAGATYALGQVVKADFACADEPGGSGLASCVGNVADGAAIDTSTTGAHELTVTATDAAGNETAVTHGYTVVVRPRPDVRIRKGATGVLVGDGVYNSTGVGQTRTGAVARGRSVAYFASIQNDATKAYVLRVAGTRSTARFRVRYLRGSTDVTAAVSAGTYRTPSLAPGATQVIKVVVTVGAKAPSGARLAGTLTAASGFSADTVRFITSRT